jgi:hypothetical protein
MRPKVRDIAAKRGTNLKAQLRELLEARQALQNLMNQPLPATTAFRLSRITLGLNPEFEAYEATRIKLCQQHGKLDETTSKYNFEGGAQEAFNAEMQKLLDSEVPLGGEKLRIELLSAAKLSAMEMLTLQWLIAE